MIVIILYDLFAGLDVYRMTMPIDPHQRGLPVTPLILLPDGWIHKSDWRTHCSTEEAFFQLLYNQCFSAALQFAISHPSPPVSDSLRRPCAISWFNLEINPTFRNDVVAVVLPLVGWRRTEILRIPAECDNSIFKCENESDNPCYAELHQCTRGWKLSQLLNLRVIVALPWPDLIPQFGMRCKPYKNEGTFVDLRTFSKRGIAVSLR